MLNIPSKKVLDWDPAADDF